MKTSSRPKFTLVKSVIPKLSDGLKTCMHKNHKGESNYPDSPSESKIIFGNHEILGN
jgi:hypothetical protein